MKLSVDIPKQTELRNLLIVKFLKFKIETICRMQYI